MKTTLIIAGIFIGATAFATETDSTGLAGDHLDLNAVMELFRESESPEDFEKRLNSKDSKVNNLDLDDDGEVDYIRVIDSGDSTAHALVLQVPINENESQDVAVIELEETSKDVVEIQIVGDEDLYGENYVLIPASVGNSPVIVNVITWKVVRFMWAPRYVFWVSPWRYRHYPAWYKPWKRIHWHAYHAHVKHHHVRCNRIYARRFHHAHTHHYHRTYSATFHAKHPNIPKTAGKTSGSNTEKSPQKKTVDTQKVKTSEGASGNETESTERKRPGSITTGSESSKSTEGSTEGSESTERKRPGSITTGSENEKSSSGSTTKTNDKGSKTKNATETKASKTTENEKKAKNNSGGTKSKSRTTKSKSNGAGKTKTKSRGTGRSGGGRR